MLVRSLLLLLALAPAAQAETYKWVDERGVVNYSNTPPPGAAKAAQQITERVSTYQTDPALRRVANYTSPSDYEVMQQQEWLQRQRLMHESDLVKASLAAPIDDGVYSYPLYYGAPRSFVGARAKRVSSPIRGGARVSHHGSFRRF